MVIQEVEQKEVRVEQGVECGGQAVEQKEVRVEQAVECENQEVDQKSGQPEQEVEWLAVPEFASRAGVSKQAVYQRLTKDLSEYCRMVDGKKMIDSRAVELVGNGQSKELEQEKSQVEQAFIRHLQEEIAVLRAEKEELSKAIAEKDAMILAFTGRFADMAENEQKIAAMALATEPPKLEAGQSVEQNETKIEQAVEPGKKGIFGWLRKKQNRE